VGFSLRHIFGVAETASQFLYRNPKNVVYNFYVRRNTAKFQKKIVDKMNFMGYNYCMEYIQNDDGLISSFNKSAHIYDEATNDFPHKIVEYINMQNLAVELPPPNGNLTLLDVGGGTGKYSLMFSKLGYNVTLVDISDESLKIAENKFKQENMKVSIIDASGENIPLGNESFDIIIMLGGVINYTPDPKKLLKECKRVLHDDGILYFDFLNTIGWCNEVNDPKFRLEIAESNEKLIKMHDWDYPARLFNYRYMEELVKENGFKIKSKYGLINLTTSLPLELRYANKYDEELLKKYKEIELEISRDKECYGTSWSCSIIVQKNK
jgi:ubiquinone/menaquinone biosynthesis C-methylase UbiE